jgi:hypothetical protein
MTRNIDHATCSARMRAFIAGDLDERTAAAVARHLQSCGECTEEHRAVALLLDDPAPLTAEERDALHAAVDAIAGVPVVGPTSGSWTRRLAPALAAAALLAVLAVAAPFVLSGSDRSSMDAGGGAGGSTAENAGGAASAAKEDAPSSSDELTHGLRFDASGRDLSRAALRRMGRRASTEPATWISSGAPRDAARLADRLTSRLIREAPANVADQVDECVETVLSRGPAVPVRGAIGTLEGTEVVVVAFARKTGRGAFDGYQVWAWPRGSCDAPVSFQAGRAR